MQKQVTIGWKVSTLNLALASLRYRAMLPLLALECIGIKCKIFATASRACLADLDVLVIVKSFTMDDLWLAKKAAELQIPVVFDLCDNIFVEQYGGERHIAPKDVFLLIASVANAIVVTTEPLAAIVREQIGERIPVYVVPDGIENKALLAAAKKRLLLPQLLEYARRLIINSGAAKLFRTSRELLKTGSIIGVSCRLFKVAIKFSGQFRRYLNWRFWAKLAYRYYDRLRAYLTGSSPKLGSVKSASVDQSEKSAFHTSKAAVAASPSHKILWFGNHGANHANFGMLDLLSIRDSLEKLATELPVELVVVSNNLEKYKKHIRPMAIPSRYIEWCADSMAHHLCGADVVVIPSSLDAFSICKSANRSALALSHGVPVVATSTPALEPLRKCITLDDFEGGLRRYLTDTECAKLHVQQGQELIGQLYGQRAIGQLWNDLINEVIHSRRTQETSMSPELIIAIHLPQDIDLARPVLDEAHRRGIHCAVWSSLTAIQRWPQMADSVPNLGFGWRIFSDDLKGFDAGMFPGSAYALLTVTETNLGPHRFTYRLTKLANAAGLYTATMQHGYENVGLSYSDEVHDIRRIRFAARQIYTWGHLETLHPDIPQQTRNKCFPVGCPKPDFVERVPLANWVPNGKPVIGIFENLHWHRYSDEYREFFLEGVRHLAEAFPDIVFLAKSHNAGMWLTGRYQGEKPEINNLIIADPKDPQWTSITAPQLLGFLAAVITTPSTVALDAARIKIPTAVVAQGLNLGNYAPLPLIECMEDWSSFVSQALNIHERKSLQEKSRQFMDRVLLPGNAAWRIVEEIVSHKQKAGVKSAP